MEVKVGFLFWCKLVCNGIEGCYVKLVCYVCGWFSVFYVWIVCWYVLLFVLIRRRIS